MTTSETNMERDEFSTTTDDGFSALIKAAVCGQASSEVSAGFVGASAVSAGRMVDGAGLVEASAGRTADDNWLAEASARVERRVMVEITRRSLERARGRVRIAIVLCATGFVMAMVGALVALAAWSPVIAPGMEGVSWFGRAREWIAGLLGGAVDALSAEAFVERWGLTLLVALGAMGAAGLFYLLDRSLTDDLAAD